MRLRIYSSSVLTLALAACGDDGGTTTDTNTADTTADVADTSGPEDTPDTSVPEETLDPDTSADTDTFDDTTEVCTGPNTCDDNDPCTEDSVVSGSFATCDLVCANRSIVDDPDAPDDAFLDSNCDGVDGDVDTLVFVAPDGSNAESCGTLAAPCGSVGYAIDIAKIQNKHVAVSAGTYDERLTLVEGVHVFGGYDRAAAWTRSREARAEISSSQVFVEGETRFLEGMLAKDIDSATIVDRLSIRTPAAPEGQGAISNYGVRVVASPGLVLTHLEIDAGAAAEGAAGSPGFQGLNGRDGNSTTTRAGAPASEARFCEGPGVAPGGAAGGNGGFDNATALAGTGANSQPQAGQGVAACNLAGGSAGRNWDNLPLNDVAGLPGGAGPSCLVHGAPGRGGLASAQLDGVESSGHFVSSRGADGSYGSNGMGGAGGGGGGSGDADTIVKGADGGGGGGGSGAGCGGGFGLGGEAGGSSIGLLAVDSEGFILYDSRVRGGEGGAGGAGGDGGPGGEAGAVGTGGPARATPGGGLVLRNSLAGGNGGRGSDGAVGGGGAGGRGGHGIAAILCRSGLGEGSGDNTFTAGLTGDGGRGGYPYGDDGFDGLALRFYEGCTLTAEVPVQLGTSYKPNTAEQRSALLAFPGGTAASGWNGEAGSCGDGMVLLGTTEELASVGGSWLCVPPALRNHRFFFQDSDRDEAVEIFGGAYVGGATMPTGECPFGARIAYSELASGSASRAAWVCYQPLPAHWRWEFRGSPEGWNPTNSTITGFNGGLVLTATNGDPWITSPPLHVDTAMFKRLAVRMKVIDGNLAGVYFMREGEGASEERVVTLAIAPSDDSVEVIFDLGAHPSWTGIVTQLRVDFMNAAGQARIESITVID